MGREVKKKKEKNLASLGSGQNPSLNLLDGPYAAA
jgi:hypothetical protein